MKNRSRLVQGSLLVIAGIMVVAAVLIVVLDYKPSGSLHPPQIGADFSQFLAQDLSGQDVRLADFRGKTVLINFWATWCPPCREEMPLLNQLYLDQRGKDFVILAVNTGEPISLAREYANNNQLTFPILVDPTSAIADKLAIYDFPTSILVGPDGIVKAIHIGRFTQETIEAEIAPFIVQ